MATQLQEKGLNYKDILIYPAKSKLASRSDADITCKLGKFTFNSPVIPANMKSILTPEICKIFDDAGWCYSYHRLKGTYDVMTFVEYANESGFGFVSISVGVKPEWERFLRILKEQQQRNPLRYRVDMFTLDLAWSYSDIIIPIVENIKTNFPNAYLVVGNGFTPEWIEWLETLDVDCAKVGVGTSVGACRTREFTGVGSTTVTDLKDCVQASKKMDIIADGGIQTQESEDSLDVFVGDISKALMLGADMKMTGRLFSGCVDSPSYNQGYFGSSHSICKQHSDHIEGTVTSINKEKMFCGIKNPTIKDIIKLTEESIKSTISYISGTNLYDLRNAKYRIVN
jgi:GMP reductase